MTLLSHKMLSHYESAFMHIRASLAQDLDSQVNSYLVFIGFNTQLEVKYSHHSQICFKVTILHHQVPGLIVTLEKSSSL